MSNTNEIINQEADDIVGNVEFTERLGEQVATECFRDFEQTYGHKLAFESEDKADEGKKTEGGFLSRIWERIKSFLNWVRDGLKRFWDWITGKAKVETPEKIKERADTINKAVNEKEIQKLLTSNNGPIPDTVAKEANEEAVVELAEACAESLEKLTAVFGNANGGRKKNKVPTKNALNTFEHAILHAASSGKKKLADVGKDLVGKAKYAIHGLFDELAISRVNDKFEKVISNPDNLEQALDELENDPTFGSFLQFHQEEGGDYVAYLMDAYGKEYDPDVMEEAIAVATSLAVRNAEITETLTELTVKTSNISDMLKQTESLLNKVAGVKVPKEESTTKNVAARLQLYAAVYVKFYTTVAKIKQYAGAVWNKVITIQRKTAELIANTIAPMKAKLKSLLAGGKKAIAKFASKDGKEVSVEEVTSKDVGVLEKLLDAYSIFHVDGLTSAGKLA